MATTPPNVTDLVRRAQAALAEVLDMPNGRRRQLPEELSADELERILDALRWTAKRQVDEA